MNSVRTKERTCLKCGAAFDDPVAEGQGKYARHCPTCRATGNQQCAVDGCDRARYQRRIYCSTHSMRLHRYGDLVTDLSGANEVWNHSDGYLIVTARGHPLADSRGSVYEHRLVLHTRIGPGTHPCHWCTKPVTWMDDLEADHVNHIRDDNRPENLVASCHGCNTRRANERRRREGRYQVGVG